MFTFDCFFRYDIDKDSPNLRHHVSINLSNILFFLKKASFTGVGTWFILKYKIFYRGWCICVNQWLHDIFCRILLVEQSVPWLILLLMLHTAYHCCEYYYLDHITWPKDFQPLGINPSKMVWLILNMCHYLVNSCSVPLVICLPSYKHEITPTQILNVSRGLSVFNATRKGLQVDGRFLENPYDVRILNLLKFSGRSLNHDLYQALHLLLLVTFQGIKGTAWSRRVGRYGQTSIRDSSSTA